MSAVEQPNNEPQLVTLRARGQWKEGVLSNLFVRDFEPFVTDEPEDFEGSDQGPNPMEYVLAASVGCLTVMISLIADELEFEFTNVETDIRGAIDVRGLFGTAPVSPHFQTVTIDANVETSESQERFELLQKEVQSRCPSFNLLSDAGIDLNINWNAV